MNFAQLFIYHSLIKFMRLSIISQILMTITIQQLIEDHRGWGCSSVVHMPSTHEVLGSSLTPKREKKCSQTIYMTLEGYKRGMLSVPLEKFKIDVVRTEILALVCPEDRATFQDASSAEDTHWVEHFFSRVVDGPPVRSPLPRVPHYVV